MTEIKIDNTGDGSLHRWRKCNLKELLEDYKDDIREDSHFRIAPCSPDLFLREYIKRDPDFVDLLKSEFSIEME